MAKFHYKDSPTLSQKKAFTPYLSEDEELILATGLSTAYIRSRFIICLMFPGIIFGLLGFGLGWILKLDLLWSAIIGLILAILIALLKTLHTFHANRYLFTTRRVIIKQGLFSVRLTAALFDKITHIEVDQGLIDRILLHHGQVIINTAGLNRNEIILKYVDYPIELKNLLERLINRERERYGMRPATVSTIEGQILE